LCYKRIMRDMREWMREKMRRRSKRGPNTSESTGKSGQEIPQNQPAPLRPSYPDSPSASNAAADGDAGGSPDKTPVAHHDDQAAPARGRQVNERGRSSETSRSYGQAKGWSEPNAQDTLVQADSELRSQAGETGGGQFVVETQPDSLAVPPAEAQAVSTKAPRGYVVLTIGLPGSGKTTWFKRRGVTPLSSDMLRDILFDDITEQRYQGLVFSTLRSLLRARLIAKMPWNYVDATNLSPHERRQWIKMARSFGYEVQAVFFDVPFEVCMERNQRRERKVSDEVMHKMQERLRPPSFKEGFNKITVVRVKSAGAGEGSAGASTE
jgi:predicted kinase